MASASLPFAAYRKPLTPERVSRYRQYRQDPASVLAYTSDPADATVTVCSNFLTHANSRVYPLTVLGHSRPQSVDSRAMASRQRQRQAVRPKVFEPATEQTSSEFHTSLDHTSTSIPKVDYREFKRSHQLRHNSTTPGKRDLSEYMGLNANIPSSKRFYKPQVVKITPRSKMILHSSQPISISVPLRFPKKPIRKDSTGLPIVEADIYESPDKATSDSLPSDDSPALTFADKLAKLRRVSAQAMQDDSQF